MRAWLIKKLGGDKVLISVRNITPEEKVMIWDYLSGKRFMSRYHAGHKKEKAKKEKIQFGGTGI